MCGLAGFITSPSLPVDKAHTYLRTMSNTLKHRGPDDSGIWYDPKSGCGLSHQRLAIQDTSSAGHQPMLSPSGRYILAYNGEIYNFLELKKELENLGHHFLGHCDSEVLLHAIDAYGIEKSLKKLNGMFAFALWDQHLQTLFLARDTVGIKPLLWYQKERTIIFGSEMQALAVHPLHTQNINSTALNYFHLYSAIPHPYTLFEDTHKVPPGHYVSINRNFQSKVIAYDTLIDRYACSQSTLITDPIKAKQSVIKALETSLQHQSIADVPLGAFLSGGIDSSLVSALLQKQCSGKLHTFSIGFTDPQYNEAPYARAIAQHLGTQHHEVILKPEDVLNQIHTLSSVYDEPFADSSQLPTLLVSEFAKKHVTVALSGDGGDELFAGYTRHLFNYQIGRYLFKCPLGVRKAMSHLILKLINNKQFNKLEALLKSYTPITQWHSKLNTLTKVLYAKNPLDLAHRSLTQWPSPLTETPYLLESQYYRELQNITHPLTQMQILDASHYLPNDILTKVDRAAMHHSLEVRVPLLDLEVIKAARSIDPSLHIKGLKGKQILRSILYDHIPKKLVDRPKMGFGIPIHTWLRGPLRSWAEELLSSPSTDIYKDFKATLMTTWQEHITQKHNHGYRLWNSLMMISWMESWKPRIESLKKPTKAHLNP
jgi:asparagine synthase (glutamine-hydrolysing)